jgi:phage baseplate assembly protein W
MAIELGQKLVKDTDAYKDYAIGLSLPLQIGNNSFNTTYQTSEQLKSNIKNLLLTRKGERLLQPEFGSGLHEILFDFNNTDLEIQVEEAITSAMEQWLPFVTIEEIEITTTDADKDRNQVSISISFRVGENVNLNQVSLTV